MTLALPLDTWPFHFFFILREKFRLTLQKICQSEGQHRQSDSCLPLEKYDSSTCLIFQSLKMSHVLQSSGSQFFSIRCGSDSFWMRSSSTSLSTQSLKRGSGSWETEQNRVSPNRSALSQAGRSVTLSDVFMNVCVDFLLSLIRGKNKNLPYAQAASVSPQPPPDSDPSTQLPPLGPQTAAQIENNHIFSLSLTPFRDTLWA